MPVRPHHSSYFTMTDNEPIELNPEDLRQKINLETGRLSWPELQRHFARGMVLVVAKELDLIEVAARIAENDAQTIAEWKASGDIHVANDANAMQWEAANTLFWANVVAPWVVVQEITRQ